MDVGQRIAFYRKKKGFSINKLAELSGISQSYLRDIELGNKQNPTVGAIETICLPLGISLNEFFSEETDSSFTQSSLIQKLYLLSPKQQATLEAFIDSLLLAPPANNNKNNIKK